MFLLTIDFTNSQKFQISFYEDSIIGVKYNLKQYYLTLSAYSKGNHCI